MKQVLRIRRQQSEFHPNAEQRVLSAGKGIFALVRGRQLLVVVNVTAQQQELDLKLNEAGLPPSERWLDLISERNCDASGDRFRLHIEPYQSLWLKPSG
jgi:hypothetical protein